MLMMKTRCGVNGLVCQGTDVNIRHSDNGAVASILTPYPAISCHSALHPDFIFPHPCSSERIFLIDLHQNDVVLLLLVIALHLQ